MISEYNLSAGKPDIADFYNVQRTLFVDMSVGYLGWIGGRNGMSEHKSQIKGQFIFWEKIRRAKGRAGCQKHPLSRDIKGGYCCSISVASARVVSVISTPPIMRAISSVRCCALSWLMPVLVDWLPLIFVTL